MAKRQVTKLLAVVAMWAPSGAMAGPEHAHHKHPAKSASAKPATPAPAPTPPPVATPAPPPQTAAQARANLQAVAAILKALGIATPRVLPNERPAPGNVARRTAGRTGDR